MSNTPINKALAEATAAATDAFVLDNLGAVHSLGDRLAAGAPSAMIRLNDGEGKVLGYPRYVDRQVLDVQLRIWFGHSKIPDDDILRLRQQLMATLARPGIFLGLPDKSRLTRTDVNGNLTMDAIVTTAVWRSVMDEGLLAPGATYCSAVFHKWLHISKKIGGLIRAADHRIFVTRSIDAVANVTRACGIDSLSFYGVPGESWSRFVTDHYPTRFNQLMAELGTAKPGSLALVGAGILGKLYCVRLYEAGCIAIDMGAIFDGWAQDIPKARARLGNSNVDWSAGHLMA